MNDLTSDTVKHLLEVAELAAYADAANEWSDKTDSEGERLLRGWNDEMVRSAGYENVDGVTPPDGKDRYSCMAASYHLHATPASVIAELCRAWLSNTASAHDATCFGKHGSGLSIPGCECACHVEDSE